MKLLLAALLLLAVSAPSTGARSLAFARPAGIRRSVDSSADRRIDVNNLNMYVTNFGAWGYDQIHSGAAGGLLFPKGTSKPVLYAGGLWLGAVSNGTQIAASVYGSEFQPGPFAGMGVATNAGVAWKVARYSGNPDDTAHVERTPEELAADPTLDPLVHHAWSEYVQGAAPLGAPVRMYRLPSPGSPGDSVDVPGPDVSGDQMIWSVYNDGDPASHTMFNTAPLGVEVHQTVYGFNRSGPLGNTVFLKLEIIDKGPNTLQNAYASLWFDPDLGGFTDDLVGCDTTLSLGYCYNATNTDIVYGSAPPAVGGVMLRGATDPLGHPLGLTSFDKYINGTDPGTPDDAYAYMQGLLPGYVPIIDPTSGLPTHYFNPGDPVLGSGWLDTNPADRRMLLSSGPFVMSPGDTQVVEAAIAVGAGNDRLESVTTLRCAARVLKQAWANRFALPDPDPVAVCGPAPVNCPRTPVFWGGACNDAGVLDPGTLATIAGRVDQESNFLNWPGGASAGFCAAMDLPPSATVRDSARREYAALVANAVSGPLGIHTHDGDPVLLLAGTNVNCSGVPGSSIGELLVPGDTLGPRLMGASYFNDDPTHRRALEGVPAALSSFFNGGAGYGYDFLGGIDPANTEAFATVELRFGSVQQAYRFLRLEQLDGTPPAIGRSYLYGGFYTVPFQAWDTTHGVQLDVAFVEREITDTVGNPLPPDQQPATFDSTWMPDDSNVGGREYLFVLGQPYTGAPNPATTHNGAVTDGTLPAMYALWSRLRSSSDVIDPADRFVFTYGLPPPTNLDGILFRMESAALTDSVAQVYRQVLACLQPINGGIGIGPICGTLTPVLASRVRAVAVPGHVSLAWALSGAASAALERTASGSAWRAVATLTANPAGIVTWEDDAVEPGTRYGYRLRIAGRIADEVWLDVPRVWSLALEGVQPNPGVHGARIAFVLPALAPARLELLDVAGRRVWRREVGALGPGRQSVALDETIPPGVYLLRLTQGRASVTARAVLLR